MRNMWKKFAAAGLAAAMGVSMLAGCGDKSAKLDGTKTAVTINDEAVSLGAVSFLTRYQQAYLYQLYSMYFGTQEIFNQTMDESTEKTYGEEVKENVLENLEEMVLVNQHAEEYDVKLTDDQKAEIEKIAQAYIDENPEEIRNKIGATKEDVQYLLELQTVQSMMREPMVKDVDTNVSDEEAQQTSVTCVSIAKVTENTLKTDESTVEIADESAVAEKVPADESTAAAAAAEEKAAAVEEANASLKAKVEQVILGIKASGNVAEADIEAIAGNIDESMATTVGQFTTNDPTDTTLDAKVVEAVTGLKDGELCEEVIETDTTYYVARVDKTFDKDMTDAKKEETVKSRKTDAYNKLVEEWKEAAEINVDDTVMAMLLVTDDAPYTLGQDESVADESAAVESEADAEAADSTAEEPTDESVTEVPASDESAVDTSAAESTAK